MKKIIIDLDKIKKSGICGKIFVKKHKLILELVYLKNNFENKDKKALLRKQMWTIEEAKRVEKATALLSPSQVDYAVEFGKNFQSMVKLQENFTE